MSSLCILRMTDKWSKRSFAVKLSNEVMPKTIGGIVEMMARLDEKELQQWYKKKKVTKESVDGFGDIQQALFEINDDGTLGETIENVKITYEGVQLNNDDTVPLELYSSKTKEAEMYLADLVVDRDNVAYMRNWRGYYRRNWRNNHSELIRSWVKQEFGATSDEILTFRDSQCTLKFIQCIARHIYNAPYELYSRYLGKCVPFKTARETLLHIKDGRGGNCSEKASVIDFICANFGIDAHLCLSGNNASGRFPEYHLRGALERSSTIFTGENQRYWEHFANIIIVNGERWLLDATGGPMPFLLSNGSEAEEYLNQEKFLSVKFIAREEKFYYHDAPLDISYGALFNMEVFLPDIDMYHIFGAEGEDEPFGLCIKPDLWICPDAYQTDHDFSDHVSQWNSYAELSDRILKLEVYQNLNGAPDKELLSALELSEPSLIADLRSIENAFVKRCRYIWRDDLWKIGYVFCRLQ